MKRKGWVWRALTGLLVLWIGFNCWQAEHEERARRGEEGQGLVEYALILILIAIVVIVVLTVVGHQVKNIFSNISSSL